MCTVDVTTYTVWHKILTVENFDEPGYGKFWWVKYWQMPMGFAMSVNFIIYWECWSYPTSLQQAILNSAMHYYYQQTINHHQPHPFACNCRACANIMKGTWHHIAHMHHYYNVVKFCVKLKWMYWSIIYAVMHTAHGCMQYKWLYSMTERCEYFLNNAPHQ